MVTERNHNSNVCVREPQRFTAAMLSGQHHLLPANSRFAAGRFISQNSGLTEEVVSSSNSKTSGKTGQGRSGYTSTNQV